MDVSVACHRMGVAGKLLFVGLAYFVSGWLGLRMPYGESHITLFWLPTGVAVAALVRCGWGVWPGIFLGAVLVNYSVSPFWPLAASIAVGNTLGPALSAYWLMHAKFRTGFDSVRDVVLFVTAGAVGMTISASGGVISLHSMGLLPLAAMGLSWLTWWMGDTVGVLLAAPLLLSLTWKNVRQLARLRAEIILWLLISGIVAWFAFFFKGDEVGLSQASLPLKFLTLPPLMWAFLRFGNAGASTAALIFAFVATFATATGHGFVLQSNHGGSLIILWLYIATVVVTEFLIITIQATRLKMDAILRESEANLRVAAAAFDAQVGIVVTDAQNRILRVNKAFTDISGYGTEDVVGRTPSLLQSGRHDAAFYAAMWDSINQAGSWQGEIWERRKSGEIYPKWMTITAVKGEDGAITNYVSTQLDVTGSKVAAEEIRRLAFYDPLTNLPNRRLLMDRLQQALAVSARNGRVGALFFVDLDHFKTLNDTLGHEQGDRLLQEVGKRLVASVRESDTVARLGGDEFVIMQEGLADKPVEAAAHAKAVGEKIIDAFRAPFQLGANECFSTPSIGIALFQDHQNQIDDLLKHADLAMYQAKSSGRNTLSFYDPRMQEVANARATLERDVRQGLQRGEFLLYYQPQMNSDARITGVEALVRWQHPERGIVAPLDFISLAEETGQILPLGRAVLEAACIKLAEWAMSLSTAHLEMAVNISARQFHHPDFVEEVLTIVERTGANATKLKLELTESLLLTNLDDIIEKMSVLRMRGIRFSLDDFGTGYSSLVYLKRLPLDQLKIDRSFVMDILTDPNDASIARTIMALGQSLGLSVIAEGVETEGQLKFLVENGCTAYQGYLFSRPLSPDDLGVFVSKNC